MADQKAATALNVIEEAIPVVMQQSVSNSVEVHVDTDSSFKAKDNGQDNNPKCAFTPSCLLEHSAEQSGQLSDPSHDPRHEHAAGGAVLADPVEAFLCESKTWSDFIDELTTHYKMTPMATTIAKSFEQDYENSRKYLANYLVEKDNSAGALKLDAGEFENLQQELMARPTDVQLRVRLVTLYQKTGRISEGWRYCCELELSQPWPVSREWYSCIVEMSENYQVQYRQKCTTDFYSIYLASLDRLVDIMAREGGTASALADIFHRMDQALYEFGSISPPQSQNLLSHFKGQLYLGCATLLVKRAVNDQAAWRDTTKLAGLLFLGAFAGEVVLQHSNVGGVRKVISGHMVQLLANGDSQWVERMLGVGSNIGERLHKAVFVVRDKISSSCLAQQTTVRSCCSLPTAAEIATYCPAFVTQYNSDLHMLVWLLARYYRTGEVLDFNFQLPGAAVIRENLNNLDLCSFLIKEDFPQAWQGKIASQVGKRMKGNMTRIMKKRTEKKKFVKGSGISGPRLTSLEKAVDEISVFRIHSHEPEVEEPTPGTSNGEYMNNRNPTRNLTSGEKKRLGQSIRDAATSNMDPSRARDIRLDSTLNQTLPGFKMDVERTLGGYGEGTNSMLNNVEHLRQRQEEDRVKDQERSAQANMMNNNMQMVQMAMMTHFVQTLTGQAPHGVPLQVGPLEVGTVQAGAGPGRSISKKTVDLYYTIDEQDSDEFPLRCELENFEDLK